MTVISLAPSVIYLCDLMTGNGSHVVVLVFISICKPCRILVAHNQGFYTSEKIAYLANIREKILPSISATLSLIVVVLAIH